ncbi:MAG TPA: extracellular solute-binding protein, partial [Candidatus Ozemobacteraceae bacterium]|nr:extracellular solute-binding protein [Candidatus Ozemobacteraceae bacterium]
MLSQMAASALELELWEYPRWLEEGEKVDRFAWVKKRLKQFEAENPGITVKLTELTWARGDEKLKIAALGGCAPDLAPGTVPLLYIREELVVPVDEYMTEAEKADL